MIVYNTASAEYNGLSALQRWKQEPECTIMTDGTAYIVGTAGISTLPVSWEITCPEAIEREFLNA